MYDEVACSPSSIKIVSRAQAKYGRAAVHVHEL
jgi:hypothetical protein